MFNLRTNEKVIWILVILIWTTTMLTHFYWQNNPIYFPINLSKAGESQFKFKTKHTVAYEVSIEFDKKIDQGEAICTTSYKLECEKLFEGVELEWELFNKANTISSGKLDKITSTSISGYRMYTLLGLFQIEENQETTIKIINLNSSDELDKLSPEIVIDTNSVSKVNQAIIMFILLLVSSVLTVVALIYFVWIRLKNRGIKGS